MAFGRCNPVCGKTHGPDATLPTPRRPIVAEIPDDMDEDFDDDSELEEEDEDWDGQEEEWDDEDDED